MYNDDELLMLSGIQHIAFCERQWALIHVEQQWAENTLTVEGHHLHEKVDDLMETNMRGDTITLRAVPLISYRIGLYGRADVVELTKASNEDVKNSILVSHSPGSWSILPVEYKRGKPKTDESDEVQLCAQAICLEEMHGICIKSGFLYYDETRHRHEVEFSERLRNSVTELTKRMHELFKNGLTPLPDFKPRCKSCSLLDICLPKANAGFHNVEEYLATLVNQALD